MDAIKRLKIFVPKLLKWIPIFIHKYLQALRIVKGSEEYTRFIILGRSRTGSNFLKGLLNSHPNILTYEETFRGADKQNYDVIKKLSNVWNKYPRKIKAVGFKLFYYHSHKGENQRLWKKILSDKSIRIIHITRRNMFKTYVSRYKAELTQRWTDVKQGRDANMVVTLDYADILSDFKWTQRIEREYRKKFSNHKVFEIVYEDLAKNTNMVMNDVLDFLKVEKKELSPTTTKQQSEKLKDTVSNYNELKKKFSGTKWSSYFEE